MSSIATQRRLLTQNPTNSFVGAVRIKEIAAVIAQKTASATPGEYNLMIGTDSQNFDTTKVVVVIALHNVGHGGIFFYEVQHVRRISNVGQKLLYETQLSLDCAEKLVAEFEEMKQVGTFDFEKHLSMTIHVDAGQNGPSKQVIPQIIGWITSCGYKAVVKPDSYAACSITNKYSK